MILFFAGIPIFLFKWSFVIQKVLLEKNIFETEILESQLFVEDKAGVFKKLRRLRASQDSSIDTAIVYTQQFRSTGIWGATSGDLPVVGATTVGPSSGITGRQSVLCFKLYTVLLVLPSSS